MTKSFEYKQFFIVIFLAVSAFLNYIDRQALAILAAPIQADLKISDEGYAFVVSSFLVAYSLGNLISAWCIEKWGVRVALAAFVLWWSTANFLTGFATDTYTLAATRFALGLAETGGFIAITVMAQASFKSSQRAFVIGLCNAAAMIGATASPPILAWIYEVSGWRYAFYITGAIGMLWSLCWFLLFVRGSNINVPSEAPNNTEILSGSVLTDDQKFTYLDVISDRKVWAIILGKMLIYPVWFFYLFWFPKYLTDERGLTVAEMGRTVWVIYLAAAVGSIVGGMVSGFMIKKGINPKDSRIYVLSFVAIFGLVGTINGFEPDINITIIVSSIVAFVQMLWQINIQTLSTDIFDNKKLTKIVSGAAVITSIFSVMLNMLVGALVATISYRPMFIVMGLAYPVAFLIVSLLLNEKTPKRLFSEK